LARHPRDDLEGAVRVARTYAQLATLAVSGGVDPRAVYEALNRSLDVDLPSEEKLLVRAAVLEAALRAFASEAAPVVRPDPSHVLVPRA
jgi:hypothetical protein